MLKIALKVFSVNIANDIGLFSFLIDLNVALRSTAHCNEEAEYILSIAY